MVKEKIKEAWCIPVYLHDPYSVYKLQGQKEDEIRNHLSVGNKHSVDMVKHFMLAIEIIFLRHQSQTREMPTEINIRPMVDKHGYVVKIS